MGLRVATNTQSMAAQRHLGINNANQKGSLEKLASGARITKSADDAAGLAISESMRAHIRSIRQNVRNAQDGISMVQVAEGGMQEITNILVRFRELSIQAASDTISDTERSFIDKEVVQLRDEINRIAMATEYDGRKLLMGEGDTLDIQVGIHNRPEEDRIVFNSQKTNITTDRMELSDVNVATKEQAQENLHKIDNALAILNENRAELGALQNRLQSSINNAQIYDENLSGARSRIYDVDVASETSELTKNNILSQASTAVLSQANQNNMLALKLI